MRTLKKTLALVLCLAMMVGLCAIGASAADYADQADIEHEEAVAVLSALGVIEGDERGFRPNDELTRAEGAAIMTRLHATKGGSGVSSFTDMVGHWAQPYVAYCEQQGIINGYGDGTFGPEDKLTFAQFAKMLLCALGYNAEYEGLVGTAWELNTAKLVNMINLAADITTFDYNQNITRDVAAQLSFNTLLQDMVDYEGGTHVSTTDGTKVDIDSRRVEIANKAYAYESDGNIANPLEGALDVGVMQFIENYFPNMKCVTGAIAETAYGEPGRVWFNGKNRLDYNYAAEKKAAEGVAATAMATYTDTVASVTSAALYKAAALTADGDLAVKENGVDGVAVHAAKAATTVRPLKNNYAGAEVKLYDTGVDGQGDLLVVKYAYLGVVTKAVAATATADRYVQMTIWANNAGAPVTAVSYETEDFAPGDFVLVYPAGLMADTRVWTRDDFEADDAIIEVKAADSVAGKLSSAGLTGGNVTTLTVDGSKYTIGAAGMAILAPVNVLAGQPQSTFTGVMNSKVTAYLNNGYVIGLAGEDVAASDYICFVGTKDTPEPINALGVGGGYETVYVNQKGETTTVVGGYMIDQDATATIGWKKAVKANANGFAYFVALDTAVEGNVVDLKATQPQIAAGILANDKTIFILKNGAKFTTYTGIAAVPAYNGLNVQAYAFNNLSGFAAAVYMDVTGKIPATTTTATIYMLTGTPVSERNDGTGTVYTFNIVKDGAIATIESTTDAFVAGLCVPTVNTKGYLTGQGVATTVMNHSANRSVDYSEGTLKIGTYNTNDYTVVADVAYTLGTDCAIYLVNTITNKLTVGEAANLNGIYGTLTVVLGLDGKVKTVYLLNSATRKAPVAP